MLSEPIKDCQRLTLAEIESATNNFNEALVIGRGGFGKVYKSLSNFGSSVKEVAIKRLDSTSNQGALEFEAEVKLLSTLRHPNLVPLIGYCSEGKEMVLAYEFMPNGTLEDHLHKGVTELSWLQRLMICIGAARGLDYLHTGTSTQHGVIHRDVKTSNILLDSNFAAKVSDFGLAKVGPINQTRTHVSTLVKGTFGYMDPCYFYSGKLTRKSDVYAFGVVLFEVLSGKRAVDQLDEDQWSLAVWAQQLYKKGRLNEIVDCRLIKQISKTCLKKFAGIAVHCLQPDQPNKRPTMADIVEKLESILSREREREHDVSGGVQRRFFNMMRYLIPGKAYKIPAHAEGTMADIVEKQCDPLPLSHFTDFYQSKDLEEIYTQKLTLEEIIGAIEDDMIQVVGISGLGGVGKTTLACEVAKKLKNQFTEVVFVTVSQNIDAKTIQEKVQVAATRIINGEKVLIILDDVWEELKLEEVGIPCGSEYMNCKILVTSRSRDVCVAMNAKVIKLNPLQDEEAWTLFERVVGESEWDGSWKQVALKIVKECGGLPLFIQSVGKALKNKEHKIWMAALHRLQDPTDEVAPFKRKEILSLKLSYDHLEDEVAKSCFLLCSMFPEDEVIGLNRLTHYGLALGIFNNPDSIQDAKHRVRVAVDSLKSSFLLFPAKEDDEEAFKMDALVRDMALFIASNGDDKFLVKSGKGLREWPAIIDRSYKKISLVENKICKLPNDEIDLPHLDTFLIQDNELSVVPNEFFRGMIKLKVLDMSDNNISSLPQSLKLVKELLMLDLSNNKSFCEIPILGEITCLEILKLRGTGITNIPKEIGRLTKLRLLDVYDCEDLSYVTPGVISMLVRLEELYLSLTDEGNCNFLVELSGLTLLNVLYLRVPELHYIPEIETLIEFDIRKDGNAMGLYKRNLDYSGSLTMPIRKLIELTESLVLSHTKDLDNILPELYQEGFDELRYINLSDCENVRSLVKTCALDAKQISNECLLKTKGWFFPKWKESS